MKLQISDLNTELLKENHGHQGLWNFKLLTQILIWSLCTVTCEHLRNKEEARADVGPGLYMEQRQTS